MTDGALTFSRFPMSSTMHRFAGLFVGVPSFAAVVCFGAPCVAAPAPASMAYAQLPLRFDANAGQADKTVKFVARGAGYDLFISATETVFRGRGASPVVMRFRGASRAARVVGIDELPGRTNYFTGNDPRVWRTGVPGYRKVSVDDLYPSTDLSIYGTNARFEYDLVVKPGGDPRRIELEFPGAESIAVDAAGDLVLRSATGLLRHQAPHAYQLQKGSARPVDCRYTVADRRVSFSVGAYDATKPLVIDPVLAYSTFYGGADDDQGYAIAVGPNGTVFLAGFTASTDLSTASAAQPRNGGQADGFVAALDATGSSLLYATYIGGSSWDTFFGLAADALGNVYVTGQTTSSDFPVTAATLPCQAGGAPGVIVKLDPLGRIAYSSCFGGSGSDLASAIALDGSGGVYIAGLTSSPDFPTTPGAAQRTRGHDGNCPVAEAAACDDGFVTKFVDQNGTLSVDYSTYLGGSQHDWVRTIAVDPSGSAYVAGVTRSADFPTRAARQPALAGSEDAFIARLDGNGRIFFSSYFGGTGDDDARAVTLQAAPHRVVVAGATTSIDLPVTGAFQSSSGGQQDAFVAILADDGSLVSLSYLGGSGDDLPLATAVDGSGNIYVGGFTGSVDFPLKNAFQLVNIGDSGNAFIAKISPSAAAVAYSSFLGGSGTDAITGLAIDPTGAAYATGVTIAGPVGSFPTVHPLQTASGGSADAFVVRVVDTAQASLASDAVTTSVLESIRSTLLRVKDPGDRAELTAAADDLTAALVAYPGRSDVRVFMLLSRAVTDLLRLSQEGGGSVSDATVESWIAALVQAARLLVTNAIGAAGPTVGEQRLQRVRASLAGGDALAAAGQPLDAIRVYRIGWATLVTVR